LPLVIIHLSGCNKNSDSISDFNYQKAYLTGTNYIKSCVSFTFDGAFVEEILTIAPLFKREGIVGTSFVETSTIGTEGIMTKDQLLELQNKYGWEIGSHTINHPSLPSLTSKQIENELKGSKAILKSMGFVVNNVAYPNGEFDDKVMAIAKKYYNTASKTLQDEVSNCIPLNTYQLIRASSNDGTTLKTYKKMVDYSFSHQRWFIIYGHAFQYTPATLSILKNLIEYIKSLNMDIVTIQKGYERFTNKIDIGFQGRNRFNAKYPKIYDYNGSYFYIDATNTMKWGNLFVNSYKASQLISDYPAELGIVFKVDLNGSKGFPNDKPGIVNTINIGLPGIDKQEYYNILSGDLWARYPGIISKKWSAWVKIN
jgi:peptidoglycan/xylan/chitin deacetylase (PgdA/CDA1 family)